MIDWQLVLAVSLVLVAASYLGWRSIKFLFRTDKTCGGCSGCNTRVKSGQPNNDPVYQIELAVRGNRLTTATTNKAKT